MDKIRYIIVHCAATPEGKDFTVADIRRWHKERGFKDIGYHYVVYRDGSVHTGRPEAKAGAHCKGYNNCSIGVCYVGGLDKKGNPKDTRTKEQKEGLERIISELLERYPTAAVKGHRDMSLDLDGDGIVEPDEWIKDCPCFDAIEEYWHLMG